LKYNENIRALRIDSDKNQKEISEFLGIDQSYYSKCELGKHPLPIEHLKKLCLYYGVSADYILGLPDDLNILNGKYI